MNNYNKQVATFLKDTGTTLNIKYFKQDFYFTGDKEKRNIFKCTLKRGAREYTFNFGDSIFNTSKFKPTKGLFNTFIKGELKELTIKNYTEEALIYIDKIKKNISPSKYNILASLNYNEFLDFQDFCDCFGYDIDSISAKKVYESVKEQNKNLQILFLDKELEKLNEIN